jgi:hypothetical protein
MLRVLLYALPLILAIYALVDLVQTDDDDVQGLPKLAWVALIVLIWIIGPIAWLVAGKRGRRLALPGRAARSAGPPPGRPLAPDDDPDFLRGLGHPAPPPTPTPPTPPPPPPPARPADKGPDSRPSGPEDDDPPITSR